jgi:hypothetical protein
MSLILFLYRVQLLLLQNVTVHLSRSYATTALVIETSEIFFAKYQGLPHTELLASDLF